MLSSEEVSNRSADRPRMDGGEQQEPGGPLQIQVDDEEDDESVCYPLPKQEEEAPVVVKDDSCDQCDDEESSSRGGLSKVLKEYVMTNKKQHDVVLSTIAINDAAEQRDDYETPSPGVLQSTNTTRRSTLRVDDDRKLLHSLDSEFETYEAEYRLQRQLLEQKVKEHDINYIARSHMVQGKLTEALEKMKQMNETKLIMAQESWKQQLQETMQTSKEMLSQERQQRLDTIQRLQDDWKDKLQLVEAVHTAQANHEMTSQAAEKERLAMKQEIKNILVTLHYQFENLTNKLSTQEDEMRLFEQTQRDVVADVENAVQDVTSYVDTIQHEVSQIQLESKALWKQCEDEQNAARDTLSKTMLELVTQTKAELSTHLEEHDDQFMNIHEEFMKKMNTLEESMKQQLEQSEKRLAAVEDAAKAARSKLNKDVALRIQETEDTIFQSIDIHMSSMENHQREMKDRLDAQHQEHEDICVVVSKLAEDFIKADRSNIKKQREVDDTFKLVNDAVNDHATIITNLDTQLTSNVESTDDRFEKVCKRLEMLENALAIEREARKSDKETAEARSQEQWQYIENLQGKLSTANEYATDLNDRLVNLQDSHVAVTNSYQMLLKKYDELEDSNDRLGARFASHLEGIKQQDDEYQSAISNAKEAIKVIESNIAQLSKDMKCRSESHVLATKEFREELSKVAGRFESVENRHTAISKQLKEQENMLSSVNVSELVDAALQPFLKQNEVARAKMEASAEEVNVIKEEIKTVKSRHEASEARIAEVKSTSESLFQHLANTVQTVESECRDDVQTIKAKVESMESELQESSTKITTTRECMSKTITEQKSSLSAVDSKVNSLKDEIKSAICRIGSRQTEYKLFREELAKEQFSMKEKVTRNIDDLLQWKREIEVMVNDTKANLATELSSQQEASDKQVAKLILKATKDEQKTFQIAIDARLQRWSEKIQKHTEDVETRISALHELVERMNKDNGIHDDSSIEELRNIVHGISEKINVKGAESSLSLPNNPEITDTLMEAVDELRADMINRNSMIIELDDRVNKWVSETTDTMRKLREGMTAHQLHGQVTDEKNSDMASLMISKTKEVTDLEARVKEMSQKLTESRYECRGLRLKLLTKNHTAEQNAGCATF